MQKPKTNNSEKLHDKNNRSSQAVVFLHRKTIKEDIKKRPLIVGAPYVIVVWWSCGESHPGPKSNLLFVYKHSLSFSFTTRPI